MTTGSKTRRAARKTLAAVAGTFAVAAAALPAHAAAAPKIEGWTMGSSNGVLAYSVDASIPGGNVATIFANGTHKQTVPTGMLTNDYGTVHAWSSDGNRVLATEVGDTTLRDFNPWTGTLVETAAEVWPGQSIQGASLSPDGLTYAWGTQGIGYRVGNPTDGFSSRSAHASFGTAWSKSDRLVWINDEADAGEVNDDPGIYAVNGASDPNTMTQHFAVPEVEYPEHVSLSADGTRLAYDTFENDSGSYGIKVSSAENGSTPHWLETGGRPTTEERFPAMSPDGTKVAFVSNRSGAFAIYTANWDGTNVQVVPNTTLPGGQQYTGLAWQPAQVPDLSETHIASSTEPGSTLMLDWASEQGTAPLTFTYNWQACTSASTSSCTDTGVTTAGYPVTNADVGKRFRVVRTATNAAGTDTLASEITTEIVAADTDPPGVPTITTKPAARSNATAPTFAWTGAEAGGTYRCAIDGAAYTACTSGSAFTVGEGAHTFRVRQVDAAGNAGDPAEHTWTADLTAPGKPTLTSRPSGTTSSTSARFTFTGDEVGGSFECRIGSDAAAWSPCSSPTDITGMGDGAKRFSIRQVDQAGNPSDPEITTWTVDTTAPGVPTISTKPAARSSATAPTFAWTGAEGGGTFLCSLDGGVYAACTSGSTFPVSGEGAHTFRVRQVDGAGNPGDPAEHTWTLDTVKPGAPTLTTKPAARSSATAPTFAWTGAEAGGTYQCAVDGGAFTTCTSGEAFPVSGQGAHTVQVRQVDAAGNVGDATEHTWTLDTVAPGTPSVTAQPQPVSRTSTATVAFTGAEAGGTFECRPGTGAWSACSSPVELTGLTDGAKSLEIRQVDAAGNVSVAPAVVEWTVDQTAPAAPTLSPNPQDVYTATHERAFTGETGGTFQCRVDDAAWEACTSPVTLAGYASGPHTFRVRQTDDAGNPGAVADEPFTAHLEGPAAPVIGAHPPKHAGQDSALFTFTGDSDAISFECRLDGGAWSACSGSTIRGHLLDGDHAFEVRGVNAHDIRGAIAKYEWEVDTRAPATPVVAKKPAAETTATDFSAFVVAGEEGATRECSLDDHAWADCADVMSRTDLAVGPHELGIRLVDQAGNVSDAVVITWTVVAPKAPVAAPQTPAAAAPAPAAKPAAVAPRAATPKAEAAAPKLTAIVGDAKGAGTGTSSAASIVVKQDGVGVGCSITGTVLTACKVDLYVDRASGATAVAASRVLVGTGTVREDAGTKKMQVDVQLNATGRALMRRSPNGLKVKVDITGTPVKGAALKATGVATLVRQTTRATVGGFAVRSAQLTPAARRQLTKLARQVKGTAVAIRVVGHTDGSSQDNGYLDKLGKRRAVAVARFLKAHGVKAKATLVTRGDAQPRATNATQAGRAKNRRVQLTITR